MERYTLYGGKINLEFDSFKHLYRANGNISYGVTSIIGVINKPALMYWAVNKAVDQMKYDFKPGIAYDEVQIDNFLSNAKGAHRKFSKDAANIGSMVHDWISNYIFALANNTVLPAQPVNEKARQSIRAFMDFTEKHNVEITSSERKIYSIEKDYCGTLDGEGIIDGKKCIIDFKTSSAIYDEYFIQVVAYMKAREEETGSKYDGAVIIRVDKESGEFEAKTIKREELDDFYNAFLGCLSIYKFQMKRKDEDKLKEK